MDEKEKVKEIMKEFYKTINEGLYFEAVDKLRKKAMYYNEYQVIEALIQLFVFEHIKRKVIESEIEKKGHLRFRDKFSDRVKRVLKTYLQI